MPKLGQHFLKNQNALALIARALGAREGETLIEIGSGHGELTSKLKVESGRWKVVAIEKDAKLAELLKKRFIGNAEIEIIEGDALKKIGGVVVDLGNAPYKVVGNIPYYLTGKLLRTIGEFTHKPTLCIFTIQKEVAERIVARPPHMNRLAASVAFWAETETLARLPRTDFAPPPNVDSAIIKLATRQLQFKTSEENYYRAVRLLFSQPRKTVLNNLAQKNGGAKEILTHEIEKIGIRPSSRPQDLSIEDIAHVGEIILTPHNTKCNTK